MNYVIYGAISAVLLGIAVFYTCYLLMLKRHAKVEQPKDERTPLDQLRAEILESLKRGEWEFWRTGSDGNVTMCHKYRACSPIVYTKNIGEYRYNGVPIGNEAEEVIRKQASNEFEASVIAEWRNAQPIKKDVDNAPKA